ncbi:hypothetical protein RHMOL_Rhmol09G0078600 [Rhododendron molle]|uniref:Uncharacterized protein n=1 Tax=Rhododendron molle TaxID=49168 RepID=A0ACC0MC15_RHOML|nr:hypothetical protein RHMOL_Rhmol09G0078600 [Rhododendron molle]
MVLTTLMVLMSLMARILSTTSSSVRVIASTQVMRGLISGSPFTYLRSQPILRSVTSSGRIAHNMAVLTMHVPLFSYYSIPLPSSNRVLAPPWSPIPLSDRLSLSILICPFLSQLASLFQLPPNRSIGTFFVLPSPLSPLRSDLASLSVLPFSIRSDRLSRVLSVHACLVGLFGFVLQVEVQASCSRCLMLVRFFAGGLGFLTMAN